MRDDAISKKPFKPSSWIATINFINHLVLFNNVLMAVFAEPGNGKTTFGELLIHGIDRNITTLKINAHECFNEQHFLTQIAAFDEAYAEDSLNSYIQKINQKKKPVLIIIDDAHWVSEEFLSDVLKEISAYESNFFHVCLIADYSLAATLNDLEANHFNDKVHSMELGGLTESETKTYLSKNLPFPKQLDQVLTDKRLEQFNLITAGNIAQINKLMFNYFNPNQVKAEPKHKNVFMQWGIAAAALLIVSSGVYLWQNPNGLDFIHIPSSASDSLVYNQVPSPSLIPAYSLEASREEVQPSPRKNLAELNDDEQRLEQMVVMDKVIATPKELNKKVASRDVSNDPELDDVDPALLAELEQLVNAELMDDQKVAQATELADATPTAPILEPQIMTDAQAAPEMVSVIPSAKLAHVKTIPKKASSKKAIKTAKKSPQKAAMKAYTIQLMASHNKQDLIHFIKVNQLKQAKIGSVNRDGEAWFVVTVGAYSKKEDALAAVKHLPSHLAKLNPWVRSGNQVRQG